MKIKVTIVQQRSDDKSLADVYEGEDYGKALEAAATVRAKGAGELKGKWIRFETSTRVKWAQIN